MVEIKIINDTVLDKSMTLELIAKPFIYDYNVYMCLEEALGFDLTEKQINRVFEIIRTMTDDQFKKEAPEAIIPKLISKEHIQAVLQIIREMRFDLKTVVVHFIIPKLTTQEQIFEARIITQSLKDWDEKDTILQALIQKQTLYYRVKSVVHRVLTHRVFVTPINFTKYVVEKITIPGLIAILVALFCLY